MAGKEKDSPTNTKKTDIQTLLSDPKYRIELHDLVQKQTVDAYDSILTLNTQPGDNVLSVAQQAVNDFDSTTVKLRKTMAYGCYFGTSDQAYLWGSVLTKLATVPAVAGSVFLLNLQLYPALLVFYAGGLAALSAKNTINLRVIFDVKTNDNNAEPSPLFVKANCTMLENAGNAVFGTERLKTPLSDHLSQMFDQPPLHELAFGQDFQQLFDEWEILIAMVFADNFRDNQTGFRNWVPVGRFSWRGQYTGASALKSFKKQLSPDWTPIKAGLFSGDVERARAALEVVENFVDKVSF